MGETKRKKPKKCEISETKRNEIQPCSSVRSTSVPHQKHQCLLTLLNCIRKFTMVLQESALVGTRCDLSTTMLLLLLDRPVGLILTYGVLGAVFMPFLAITLLILLNRRRQGALPHSEVPQRWRNGWLSNALMMLCAVLFAVLAANELREILADYVPW